METEDQNTSDQKLRLVVGEPWDETEEDSARGADQSIRNKVVVGFATLLSLLLVAFAAYGMAHRDDKILEDTLLIVQIGVVTILAWALGKPVAGVLKRIARGLGEDE